MSKVLKALIIILKSITLQRGLYCLAFLAFGIGDGLTGAYMMDARGPYIEANPVIRDLFLTAGFNGMILFKLWATFMLLLVIHIRQGQSLEKVYWTVNGVLFAIIAGGLTGVYFNMNVINGAIPPEPDLIIIIYAALVLVFIEIGSFMDNHVSCKDEHVVEVLKKQDVYIILLITIARSRM